VVLKAGCGFRNYESETTGMQLTNPDSPDPSRFVEGTFRRRRGRTAAA